MVKIHKNEAFPADLILLNSSEPKGICYIETKNLDGETNLKHKIAHKDLIPLCTDDNSASSLTGVVKCEPPNEHLYKFDGAFYTKDKSLTVSLDHQ